MRHPIFSIFATCWLLFLCAFEMYHFVQGVPWPGYTHMVNYISFFWAVIFLTGCTYLLRFQMRRPVVPFIAFGGAIVHGVAILVGGGWQSFVELGSGIVLMILGFYTLNRRAVRELHHTDLSHQRAA